MATKLTLVGTYFAISNEV
jgi:hypothetical protein